VHRVQQVWQQITELSVILLRSHSKHRIASLDKRENPLGILVEQSLDVRAKFRVFHISMFPQ
jgi:hypothetical protein